MPAPRFPTHIRDLVFDERNPRRHTPRNIGMIAEVLQKLGPMRSIVIDEDNEIIAGNGVVDAAAQAGIEHVRVYDRETGELGPPPPDGETAILAVRVSGLTDEQKRQYAVADNRTAELAEWDTDVLSGLLEDGVDLDPFWFTDELHTVIAEGSGDGPGGTIAPEDFPSYDDDIETQYCCPKCSYEWSGKPR